MDWRELSDRAIEHARRAEEALGQADTLSADDDTAAPMLRGNLLREGSAHASLALFWQAQAYRRAAPGQSLYQPDRALGIEPVNHDARVTRHDPGPDSRHP